MGLRPEVAREMIAQENTHINNRMTWFLLLQGFMFTAIAFAWEKSVSLSVVFCTVGILSSISVGILLRLTILAMKDLEMQAIEADETVIGRGSGDTAIWLHLLLPWHLLPVLFVFAWVALILIRLGVIPG